MTRSMYLDGGKLPEVIQSQFITSIGIFKFIERLGPAGTKHKFKGKQGCQFRFPYGGDRWGGQRSDGGGGIGA